MPPPCLRQTLFVLRDGVFPIASGARVRWMSIRTSGTVEPPSARCPEDRTAAVRGHLFTQTSLRHAPGAPEAAHLRFLEARMSALRRH